MSRKNNKGKPTRKDIESALGYIGRKLQYLEQLTITTENIVDSYIEFKGERDSFLEFLNKKFPEKKVEEEKKSS